jgi:hypothetical protein
MEAAHITWRPLGELFVERGLITQEELEDALVEQRETRKRLGTILVSRGLVSGPELTSVLVDQLGMELTKESGFGSGLWDEIRKRHERPRQAAKSAEPPPVDAAEPAPAEPAEPPAEEARKPSKPRTTHPAPTPAANGDEVAAAIEQERAALTAAFTEERAEREMELMQERAALEAAVAKERETFEKALDAERAARRKAEEALAAAGGDAAGRAEELAELAGQVAELRGQVQQSAKLVTAGQAAVERVKVLEAEAASERAAHGTASEQLETRLTALEDALAAAQARERSALDELDAARGEANAEATELRASIKRVRGELDRLDQATSWFEYWSGAKS